MTEPTMPAQNPNPPSPPAASEPPAPQPAAAEPSHAAKPRSVSCPAGTPDWLRTRFSDGFAAHEFG
jgi:hypothetical protein